MLTKTFCMYVLAESEMIAIDIEVKQEVGAFSKASFA